MKEESWGTDSVGEGEEGRVGKRGGRHSIYTVGNPLWMCRINGMKACRACRTNSGTPIKYFYWVFPRCLT